MKFKEIKNKIEILKGVIKEFDSQGKSRILELRLEHYKLFLYNFAKLLSEQLIPKQIESLEGELKYYILFFKEEAETWLSWPKNPELIKELESIL